MTHILTFSSLYPNSAQPRHGLFVEQRLRQLLAADEVSATVVAPVPWFPFKSARFGDYARFARVPGAELRHGIDLVHPRYPVIPKVGMNLAPTLMARFCRRSVSGLNSSQRPVALIDAHYFFPDGVAAALIAQKLALPLIITARGSDINVIANYKGPRRQILWAASQAAAVVTVSLALKRRLVELGVDEAKVVVLRNGVDHDFFTPLPREATRVETGMSAPTLLSVGNLIELKGHHLAIEALVALDGYHLVIAGDGPERGRLERLAIKLEVADRVRFSGSVSQEELHRLYCAADVLVLASSREGMANVLLESLACGTPVVATAISGTPEVVSAAAAGVLMRERTASAIVDAVRSLMQNKPDRQQTLGHAQQFSWTETTEGQLRLIRNVVSAAAR